MAAGPGALVRYIRQLVTPSARDETTDAGLLGRFVADRDESAFAALVDRHGPMVLRVCQRVLGDAHEAEDAFQAAFLVLARKAATVRPRDALPAWLHGVAHRVALKARSARARRARDGGPPPEPPIDPRPGPEAEASICELLLIIDEELQRLTEVYRLPVILCCLEGRSPEEAARELGWTRGSVKGRLERGRARLHDRLTRRGLTLAAALAAAEASRGTAAAAAARLAGTTVHNAMVFAAGSGLPGGAAGALAGQVIKGMAAARAKVVAVALLATGLLATGLLVWAVGPFAKAPRVEPSPTPDREPPMAAGKGRLPAPWVDPDAPISVQGRVVGPDGKAFAGAKLYVGYSIREYVRGHQVRQPPYPLRATSGPDGGFRFTFTPSELTPRWFDDSVPAVLAVADGCGPDWVEVKPDQGAVSLKLVEDLPVTGRVLDQDRNPVAGAKVVVVDVTSHSEDRLDRWLRGELKIDPWIASSWRGPIPGQAASATTGADGRFRLTGFGRDRIVALALEGPTIAHTYLHVVTRPAGPAPFHVGIRPATFDHQAAPSRSIRGVVRDKATGKPVPGVRVSARWYLPSAVSDSEGRYELAGCPQSKSYHVMAEPLPGLPYFAASLDVPEVAGLDPLTADFDLIAGTRLQGRVLERATRRAVKTAMVEYYALFPNPHSTKVTNSLKPASTALVQPDGQFSLVVLPGPGVVCVRATPRASYAAATVDDRALAKVLPDGKAPTGKPSLYTAARGARGLVCCVEKYAAVVPINLPEKGAPAALDVSVRMVPPPGQP